MSNAMIINQRELTVKEYNGQRVVTLWDIARVHNKDYREIKQIFDNNIKRFIKNEDYYLVNKNDQFVISLADNKEIDKRALNPIKEIPIFTEDGYLLISKPMTDELSWSVQRQLIKSYFKLQEVKQLVKNNITIESLQKHSDFLMPLIDACGLGPEVKLLTAKSLYRLAGVDIPFEITLDQKLYDLETIAKRLGIMSEKGNPHANAVSAIIKKVDIPETLKLDVLETNGKWTGSVTKYKEEVFPYITNWLEENGNPEYIESAKRKFKVIYK